MTYRELINQLGSLLEEVGEEVETLIFAFKEKKKWTTTDFALHQAKTVSESDKALLEEIAATLSRHFPVQYYLGYAYFQELTLAVSPDVLIPRQETEELVELILSQNTSETLRILDIGTGSGAIALALKKQRPNWDIVASDISEKALQIAKQNATNLNLAINLVQSDLFSQISGDFDIIVSNPPYIAEEDCDEVGINVLTYEPHTALFADDAGYALYNKIISQAPTFLRENGRLYFEIGYKQGKIIQQRLEETFPSAQVQVLKDVFGQDRMVVLKNDR